MKQAALERPSAGVWKELERPAYEWKVIGRVPRIRILSGERVREFVLSDEQETVYLGAASQPLHDVALLIFDPGLRVGEALDLQWSEVHLDSATGCRYGYFEVPECKSCNARRTLSLTKNGPARCYYGVLTLPPAPASLPMIGATVRCRSTQSNPRVSPEFVIHGLRHTMLTRPGESGTDAFVRMRIAGHSTVTAASQRYVHPSPEAQQWAFERLEALNGRMGRKGADGAVLPAPLQYPAQ